MTQPTVAVRHTVLPTGAEMHADDIRSRWQRLNRAGFQVPPATVDKAKADCAAEADAYLRLVYDISHLLARHGVTVDLGWGGTRLVRAA